MERSFYDDKEAMPPDEREKYYNKKVRWVVEYAYKNAPAVREKLEQAGVHPSQVNKVEDLQRIPITSVANLIEAQRVNPPCGGYLAVPVNSLNRVFMAMGPEVYPMADTKIVARGFYAAGMRQGDIVLNAMPYHPTYAGLLIDDAAGHLGITVIPSGPGNTDLKIEALQRLKPTVYTGTGSFLMSIIKRAEELGYDFRGFALRIAILGAEKVSPSLKKVLRDDYKISDSETYGVGGVGIAGYECSQKNGMHIPEELILEVVDPVSGKRLGPGEPGEAVFTCFNETYPLIRLGSGDLVSYTDEPCPCGRTSPRVISVLGRIGEATKVRGLFLHPGQLEKAIAQIPQISQFQAVVTRQEHKDVLNFNIELENEQVDKEEAQEMLREMVSEICRLRIDNIHLVPRGTIPEGNKRIVDERVWE